MYFLLSSCFFFFNQKTAYEMRISDWSSDVCSSDLPGINNLLHHAVDIRLSIGRHRDFRALTGEEFRNRATDAPTSASDQGCLAVKSSHPLILFVFRAVRSEEHTSELQSLMRNSYAVFC